MKATYSTPQTRVVVIEAAQMIAASTLIDRKDNGDLFQDFSDPIETPETENNLSRRSQWDDDEDDF